MEVITSINMVKRVGHITLGPGEITTANFEGVRLSTV
jgi:hypothetical protein